MEKKQKSIHDILPHDLIHTILLKVPARNIVRLKCVSKLWYSLISDPHFAELHFQYSPTATNAFIFTTNCIQAYLALFIEDNHGARLKVVCKHKGVSLPCKFHLYGFGYDASQDDFLVVVAWQDKDDHYHFDCVSLRTNSLINLDAALPKSLGLMEWQPHGLLLNGAIHWLPLSLKTYRDTILIFDLKERTFSMISAPEQPEMSACPYSSLALLGGCLALYYPNNDSCNTHIWVMKEYKVHSSWTLYQIPCVNFQPLCLSSNGNIIGRGYISNDKVEYLIYIVRGDLVKHIKNLPCQLPFHETVTVYTESFLSLPTDIKDKDNRPSESERCQTKKEN
ncbi:hypothetical protein HN873_008013 [Arachis hypogaea]